MEPGYPPAPPPTFVQTFVLPLAALLALTLVAQLATLAFDTDRSFASVLLPSVLAIILVTAPLAGLGLWLGRQVGLGAPLLTGLLLGRHGSARQLLQDTRLAIPLGLGVGAILLALRALAAPYMPAELPELGHRGALGGLLVSIGAAVGEEIWLRLGVMTCLVWLLMRARSRSQLDPDIAWPAILGAAFLFGLIHLPQLAGAGAATPAAVAGTILGNAVVGTACGWLYWRRSLIAAMLAHLAVDLVLHVLPALVA